MEYIWPIVTGVTFIDIWTVPHIAFWVLIGSIVWPFRKSVDREVAFWTCVGVALGWEVFEKFAEHRWPDRWLNPESFVNSWISDPLTCVVGYYAIWFALEKYAQRRG